MSHATGALEPLRLVDPRLRAVVARLRARGWGTGDGPGVSVNFIRRETMPLRLRRGLAYAAVGFALANGLLAVGLLSFAAVSTIRSSHLQAGLQAHSASAKERERFRTEMETLRQAAVTHLSGLEQVVGRQRERFPAAGKLAALTRTLPPRMWVTHLSGRRDGRQLALRAAYLIDPADPYALPTKAWFDALRQDAAFAEGLQRLELVSSSRATQGAAELFVVAAEAAWSP